MRSVMASLLGYLASLAAFTVGAEECTQPSNPIETDRPDITNSSIVLPVGSFQSENGINLSRRDGALVFDGTNSRLRLGIAPCPEVLVDLPSNVTAFHGFGASGFTNLAPAVKWQISPIPEKFDLSMTTGVGLPTGAGSIAGPGAQPYLQFPWSVEIGHGWAITGMVTNFFIPADPVNRYTNQSTLVIERQFGERAFLFAEYVGEFPLVGRTSHMFNSGGGYRQHSTDRFSHRLRPQPQCADLYFQPRVFFSGNAYPADSGSSICSRGADPARLALLRGLSRLMMSQ